ncbi:suppressor of fused domain protein [Agromyces sp. NPDC057679]|uniref:suppressor of fused domain protein n=1 Tax=Agromyces sp. NPDC057679 TaxID=3346207 RepID=UPI0036707193
MQARTSLGDGLIEHLEAGLGIIQEGWADRDDKGPQVVRFAENGAAGWTAYSTLGLSRHSLASRVSGRVIRMELLMLVRANVEPRPVVALLHDVAGMVMRDHGALLRGDVVCPESGLGDGSALNALYVTTPAYLPVEFATFHGPTDDVVIAWLVPISPDERAFVDQHGWSRFEDVLVEQNPDLIDVNRPPCIRPNHDWSG